MTDPHILATNRDRTKRRIVGAVFALMIGVECYWVASDFSFVRMFRQNSDARSAVAEMVRSKNEVRVQLSDAMTWDNAAAGQVLHEGETVMTLKGGQADIAFLNGLGVTLGEETLITLELTRTATKKHSFKLKLLRGSVRTERAPEDMRIQVGNFELKANAGSNLILARDSENAPEFAVQVSTGLVTASNGKSTQDIHEGEVGTLARGNVAVSRLPFSPQQPPDRAVLTGAGEGEPITFQWKVAPSVAGRAQLIEVSTTPEFTTILRDQTIAATEPPMESVRIRFPGILNLEAGYYYWRVRTTSGEKVVGPTASFSIARARAPKLYVPAPGVMTSTESTEFIWEAIPEAEGYELRIGNQVTLTRVPHHSITSAPAAPWSVRAKVRGEWGAWSESRSLSASPSAKPSLTPEPASKAAPAAPPPPDEIDAVIERAPQKSKGKSKKK